jgi:hypothetical protein
MELAGMYMLFLLHFFCALYEYQSLFGFFLEGFGVGVDLFSEVL